ncbi:MAG: cytochrome c oxidase subunit II [Thermomicrobiales bacterium]|nr:cytochrome c oxidase subunit II [Thermomicrobiales bacterium]
MFVLYALIVLGLIWSVIWFLVITRTARTEPEAEAMASAGRLRRWLLFPMVAVLIVGFFISLYWLPYTNVRAERLGEPQMTVEVTALQWAWIVKQTNIPAHVPVEFALTTEDVNHDFAIYDPEGRIVAQSQVMPGFTNRLIFQFDQPGEYVVRCLEYCGLGHPGMEVRLNVA